MRSSLRPDSCSVMDDDSRPSRIASRYYLSADIFRRTLAVSLVASAPRPSRVAVSRSYKHASASVTSFSPSSTPARKGSDSILLPLTQERARGPRDPTPVAWEISRERTSHAARRGKIPQTMCSRASVSPDGGKSRQRVVS